MESPLVESVVGPKSSAPGQMLCLRCKSRDLAQSGGEPYRLVCAKCGQNYFAVMQLIPVAPKDRNVEGCLLADEGCVPTSEGD